MSAPYFRPVMTCGATADAQDEETESPPMSPRVRPATLSPTTRHRADAGKDTDNSADSTNRDTDADTDAESTDSTGPDSCPVPPLSLVSAPSLSSLPVLATSPVPAGSPAAPTGSPVLAASPLPDALDADALLDGAWSTVGRPLRISSVEPWPRGSQCVGASVLAFCIDPTHDRIYFLLGRERKVLAWGAGSARWSDFGGGRARTDADPADTAAREFWQETAGCVRFFDGDGTGLRLSYADIAAALRRGEYVVRLETAVPSSSGSSGGSDGERIYITYVVQVPWDPRAVMRFQHCRALLSGLHKQLLRVPLEPAEAEALRPPDAALRAARERWLLSHPAVSKRTRVVPRALVYGAGPVDAGGHVTHETQTAQATQAARITQHRTWAPSETERVPVVDAVNLDFMEKESLELWSVPQLRRALAYDGIMSNRDGSVESLRPGFITILAQALEELGSRHPVHFGSGGDPAMLFPTVSFKT